MILYHYTSVETLLKIIENIDDGKICLRATHAKFFNDPHEYELAISLLKSSLIDYEKKKSIKNGYGKKFNSKLFARLGQMFGNPFILSFSENQDDLTMWRSYGSDGKGIAIGFDKEMLVEYSNLETSINTKLIKCQYDKSKIINGLTKYWEYYYDKIDLKEKNKIGLNDFNFPVDLTNFSFSFKRNEYYPEKEWRLCKSDWDTRNIKFRESDGLIIPYINYLLPKEIIKKIIIGPCSNKQLSEESIKMFMNMKKILAREFVLSSKVPYRKI